MYLKRKLCTVANECSFEIGRITVLRACVIKRVRLDLYGTPCMKKTEWLILATKYIFLSPINDVENMFPSNQGMK